MSFELAFYKVFDFWIELFLGLGVIQGFWVMLRGLFISYGLSGTRHMDKTKLLPYESVLFL